MERRYVFVPKGRVPPTIPYSRIIVTPNGVIQRYPISSPYAPRMGTPYARPLIHNPFPVRQIVIRRPLPVNPCNNPSPFAPPSHNRRLSFDPYPMTHQRPGTVYRNRDVERFTRVEASHIAPPDEIDVGRLAFEAERAIGQCGITRDRQIWFEAIMMTLGENMTVVEASEKIGVNLAVLLRLMNMVRIAMGFPRLTGLHPASRRQFETEPQYQPVRDEERSIPVQRVIRVVQQRQAPPTPKPSVSLELHEESSTKWSEISVPEDPLTNLEQVYSQLVMPSTASTGPELMEKSLHLIKGASTSEAELTSIAHAKMEIMSSEQSIALEYASIASRGTVLREERRTDCTGSYNDLQSYFKNLLLRHKQDANPSIIRALSTFVADKKANFNQIIAKEEKVNRHLVRTMLRMALFERRLESAQIDVPDVVDGQKEEEEDMKENDGEKGNGYKETSQEWLSWMVIELSVPMRVTDVNIVLDLAEMKMDRACLKALCRLVIPLIEKDSTIKIAMERLIMDGYYVASGVSDAIYQLWSARMEKMLTCILMDYPISLAKWKSLAAILRTKNASNTTGNRRESTRIKTRETSVSDSLYMDKIFDRDLKKSLIAFLKKLKSSGFPINESSVRSIGEKIMMLVDERRSVKKESWSEWINLVLETEENSLYQYMDRDG